MKDIGILLKLKLFCQNKVSPVDQRCRDFASSVLSIFNQCHIDTFVTQLHLTRKSFMTSSGVKKK